MKMMETGWEIERAPNEEPAVNYDWTRRFLWFRGLLTTHADEHLLQLLMQPLDDIQPHRHPDDERPVHRVGNCLTVLGIADDTGQVCRFEEPKIEIGEPLGDADCAVVCDHRLVRMVNRGKIYVHCYGGFRNRVTHGYSVFLRLLGDV